MVGGGDLNQSMASISIEKSFLSFIILGVWGDMVFFLSPERGKMNRKEMEIEWNVVVAKMLPVIYKIDRIHGSLKRLNSQT